MPLLINKKFINNKNKYLKYLQSANIETRPIISGNFTNQKCIDLHKIKYQKKKLINYQEIEKRGFFIGLPTKPLSKKKILALTNHLLKLS